VRLAEGATLMVDIVGEACDIGAAVVIELIPEEGGLGVPVARVEG
jgi:hypothetical protein